MRAHLAILSLVAAVLACAPPSIAAAGEPGGPPSEILAESGWVQPLGDLRDSFAGTPAGFGAGAGWEVGLRWRYRLSAGWSLAPAFHVLDFKDAVGPTQAGAEYRIRAGSFRYSLEVMRTFGRPSSGWRPFVAAGSALARNRVSGLTKDLQEGFESSTFSLAHFLRLGVRAGAFEAAAVYTLNRFATWRFFWTGQEQDYAWDTFGIRAAWSFPLD